MVREAHDLLDLLTLGHVDGDVAPFVQESFQAFQPLRHGEHRVDAIAGRLEQPLDDQPPFGDEEAFAIVFHRPAQREVRLECRGMKVGELDALHVASLPLKRCERKGGTGDRKTGRFDRMLRIDRMRV